MVDRNAAAQLGFRFSVRVPALRSSLKVSAKSAESFPPATRNPQACGEISHGPIRDHVRWVLGVIDFGFCAAPGGWESEVPWFVARDGP